MNGEGEGPLFMRVQAPEKRSASFPSLGMPLTATLGANSSCGGGAFLAEKYIRGKGLSLPNQSVWV